eukprot:CAMPEP_0179147424 /NCGR_PEP_ID=MMETSP0796-20121207/71265_1 /TAXON_ID=73915 /ORGANISM="Pyrodinium bahamense, Strain pbaha01" /LENGTH=287 /DNA_ID=CAMNT_0020848019 /DNA_START=623 /DNA_END=1485 /DNA_ORIENTATION=+
MEKTHSGSCSESTELNDVLGVCAANGSEDMRWIWLCGDQSCRPFGSDLFLSKLCGLRGVATGPPAACDDHWACIAQSARHAMTDGAPPVARLSWNCNCLHPLCRKVLVEAVSKGCLGFILRGRHAGGAPRHGTAPGTLTGKSAATAPRGGHRHNADDGATAEHRTAQTAGQVIGVCRLRSGRIGLLRHRWSDLPSARPPQAPHASEHDVVQKAAANCSRYPPMFKAEVHCCLEHTRGGVVVCHTSAVTRDDADLGLLNQRLDEAGKLAHRAPMRRWGRRFRQGAPAS